MTDKIVAKFCDGFRHVEQLQYIPTGQTNATVSLYWDSEQNGFNRRTTQYTTIKQKYDEGVQLIFKNRHDNRLYAETDAGIDLSASTPVNAPLAYTTEIHPFLTLEEKVKIWAREEIARASVTTTTNHSITPGAE